MVTPWNWNFFWLVLKKSQNIEEKVRWKKHWLFGHFQDNVLQVIFNEIEIKFLIARLARSDPRNRFSVGTVLSIYSILVYFIMFSFQVLTCLRIVSIRIILNLNKFRHVQTCLRITWIVTIHIILNLNKFRHDWGW